MKLLTLLLILLFEHVILLAQKKPLAGEKVGETMSVTHTSIDWERYDTGSTVLQNNISPEDLKGRWKAYRGVYRFNNVFNEMNLTTPFMVEIKNGGIRRSKKDAFGKFTLLGNYLFIEHSNAIDTGVINRLTPKELTISWKAGSNYTRYFYRK